MKKLLILGGNYIEENIVKAAKELGFYTITTDNHSDWNLSPAKKISDEAWNISWSEIDKLADICKKEKIDGVIAGFSEFRVDCMIQLCKKLNLPCSLTKEQLEITRNKKKFKELLRKFNIQVIHDYTPETNIHFPVIVKPVDRAGSIGINVAYNSTQLNKYYDNAIALSPSKDAIIEDFINDGIKFDAYYFVKETTPYLLGTSDTIMCNNKEGAEILQKTWIFPSKAEHLFLKHLDKKIKNMIQGINIKNCYITMSAFYKDKNFYFFEAGFRLSGDLSFNYYWACSGINYLKTMILQSLNENNKDQFIDIYNLPEKKSAILNYFCKNGVIKNFNVPDTTDIKEIIAKNIYAKSGETILNETNVFKKIAMLTIVSENTKELTSIIEKVNNKVVVTDNNGNDLIYERLSSEETNKFFDEKNN